MDHFIGNPTHDDIERARHIVLRFGWNSMAYQILNPGMSLWFAKNFEGVIGFVQTPTHYIVAGAPVTAEEHLAELTAEFLFFGLSNNKKICFFGAQERIAGILSAFSPTSKILLGAQPVWKPAEWLSTIENKQSLRAQIRRAKNKHLTAEVVQDHAAIDMEELRGCLENWIAARFLPPMHFLVEPNTLDRLGDRIVVTARKQRHLVGFCIASPIPLRNGWLVEQIIRSPNAPNGTAEFLLRTLITEMKARNSDVVTLGLSPLSRHYRVPFNHPLWLRFLLQSIRSYGRILYNFDGLDSFKAKFLPSHWEPVFAITNEEKPSPKTLYAIATAFSVISPIQFILRGCLKYGQHVFKKLGALYF